MALRSGAANLYDQVLRNDGRSWLGDRKFPTANKNAGKVEHANIFGRTRAIPKSFAHRAVGEVVVAQREVGC